MGRMNKISKRQFWVIVIVTALVSWAVAYLLRIWTDWDSTFIALISGFIASIPGVLTSEWFETLLSSRIDRTKN